MSKIVLMTSKYAAINAKQWSKGAWCGACVVARCADKACKATAPVVVQILDECPECALGDLDFSVPAFKELTGLSPSRVAIEWQFLPGE